VAQHGQGFAPYTSSIGVARGRIGTALLLLASSLQGMGARERKLVTHIGRKDQDTQAIKALPN